MNRSRLTTTVLISALLTLAACSSAKNSGKSSTTLGSTPTGGGSTSSSAPISTTPPPSPAPATSTSAAPAALKDPCTLLSPTQVKSVVAATGWIPRGAPSAKHVDIDPSGLTCEWHWSDVTSNIGNEGQLELDLFVGRTADEATPGNCGINTANADVVKVAGVGTSAYAGNQIACAQTDSLRVQLVFDTVLTNVGVEGWRGPLVAALAAAQG